MLYSFRGFLPSPDLDFEPVDPEPESGTDDDFWSRPAEDPLFNGVEAMRGEFPWLAMLGAKTKSRDAETDRSWAV